MLIRVCWSCGHTRPCTRPHDCLSGQIPLWGGERLTVFGNNLGYELADLESLTVAGVSCSPLSVTGSPITEVVCASTPPAPSVAAAGVTVVTAFGTGSLPAPSVYNCQNGPGVADCETCQGTVLCGCM